MWLASLWRCVMSVGCIIGFAILSSIVVCRAQVGIPPIHNYDKGTYAASIANYDILTTPDGHVYAANGGGFLSFDGFAWRSYELPNKSLARSMVKDGGRVYIGGQDAIGYYDVSRDGGDLEFVDLLAPYRDSSAIIEDVWDITFFDEQVFFVSSERLYRLSEDGLYSLLGEAAVHSIALHGSQLAVALLDGDVVSLDGAVDVLIPKEAMDGGKLIELHSTGDRLLALLDNGYILCYHRELGLSQLADMTMQGELTALIPQCIATIADEVLVGTRFGGVVVLHAGGDMSSSIGKRHGLQSNNVHGIAVSQDDDIWLALANGIDLIIYSSPVRHIQPDGDLEGSVYTVAEVGGKMYFGTNNGLYWTDDQQAGAAKQEYYLVPGTQGQVWRLDIVDGELFMAHHRGAFKVEVDIDRVVPLSTATGAWQYVLDEDQRHMYVGTYHGIEMYELRAGEWTYVSTYDDPVVSCRILAQDGTGDLWVSHPYIGVYRLELDDQRQLIRTTLYRGERGLPSEQLNYLFVVNGEIYIAAMSGVYEFDRLQDKFVVSEWLNAQVPAGANVRYLASDDKQGVWYVTTSEVGYLTRRPDGMVDRQLYPELVGKFIGGFEHLYIHDDTTVIACSDVGAYAYELGDALAADSLSTILISVLADTVAITPDTHLPSSHNTVEIIVGNSSARPDVRYQVQLYGYDESPRPVHTEQRYVYSNLPSGDYLLEVYAIGPQNQWATSARLPFTIDAPWYWSPVARGLYLLLIACAVVALLLIPRKRHTREKALLVNEKIETEQALQEVLNEKLKSEVDYQNAQLASSTLHLVQKNETLLKVKQEIEAIYKSTGEKGTKQQLKRILSSLKDDIRLGEDWDNFSLHFDKVHTNFIQRIKKFYPQLSPKDLKLAAYLRMNLSTKEIAPLLNISVRGVEISRYRLRKKLELDSGTNLSEWMMDF